VICRNDLTSVRREGANICIVYMNVDIDIYVYIDSHVCVICRYDLTSAISSRMEMSKYGYIHIHKFLYIYKDIDSHRYDLTSAISPRMEMSASTKRSSSALSSDSVGSIMMVPTAEEKEFG